MDFMMSGLATTQRTGASIIALSVAACRKAVPRSPERWEERFMPWLTATTEKMTTGTMTASMTAAMAAAAAALAPRPLLRRRLCSGRVRTASIRPMTREMI